MSLVCLSNNAPYTYCSCLITAHLLCTSSSISSVSKTARTIGYHPKSTTLLRSSMQHLLSIVRTIQAAPTCSARCLSQTLSQPNRLCLGFCLVCLIIPLILIDVLFKFKAYEKVYRIEKDWQLPSFGRAFI